MTENSKGVIALVFLALVFATQGVFARYLGTGLELFEQTYLRIGLALIFAAVLIAPNLSVAKVLGIPRMDLLLLTLRSVALYIGVVLFVEAILHTKLSNATFIETLPFLPIFGYFLLKERLHLKTVLAIGVGFMGVVIITLSDITNLSFGYGEILAFISMFAFNFSYTARKLHSEYLTNMESAAFMFLVGTLFLFVSSLVVGESIPTISDFTPFILGALILAAILNVGNLYLTNYAFQRVKVGIAGNILMLEIVFALMYSIFLYGEIPIWREIFGGALIVLSVYLVNRFENLTHS